MNVQLSFDETYADIVPVRRDATDHRAYLSIMRGCNNMCSFCIVPFTRGRERSRDTGSVLEEVKHLSEQGVKEVTLLGQNVNSYHDKTAEGDWSSYETSHGFGELYKLRKDSGARFADLLTELAYRFPEIRFRFTSPHPKDFPEPLIESISSFNNICSHVHLPAQSGSSAMLRRMRRNHTREAYLELASDLRSKIPGVALSTDLIFGFCGETEEEFQDTLDLIEQVKFDFVRETFYKGIFVLLQFKRKNSCS